MNAIKLCCTGCDQVCKHGNDLLEKYMTDYHYCLKYDRYIEQNLRCQRCKNDKYLESLLEEKKDEQTK